jgi:chemotaxis response regulator CheB
VKYNYLKLPSLYDKGFILWDHTGRQDFMDQNIGQQDIPIRPQKPSNEFIIVSIGASAGALAAFEKLFTSIPANLGLALVVIQPESSLAHVAAAG